MQHRIVNLNMYNMPVFAQKNLLVIGKKKYMINQKWQNIEKCRLCVMPSSEVTILFNQHFIIVGNTVGKSPRGILHSNPIYLVLTPLKLQNSWRIFDRPVSSLYCKYSIWM